MLGSPVEGVEGVTTIARNGSATPGAPTAHSGGASKGARRAKLSAEERRAWDAAAQRARRARRKAAAAAAVEQAGPSGHDGRAGSSALLEQQPAEASVADPDPLPHVERPFRTATEDPEVTAALAMPPFPWERNGEAPA